MKNDKKCTGSCGGACDGCDKPRDAESARPCSHVAREAICEMAAAKEKAEKEAAERAKCIDEQADEFIADCEAAGKNPMEVVSYVARRERISVSGDAPECEEKRHAYDLLRAVVAKVVRNMFEEVSAGFAEDCEFDTERMGEYIRDAMNERRGGDEDCDDEEEDDREDGPRVRVVPMKIRRYDFVF